MTNFWGWTPSGPRRIQLKAKFLVDYSSGKIPTFGKSKSSWKDFCEEIQHNGDIGCAKKASNFELEGSIQSRGSEYAGWVASIIFPAIYGGVHLTPWKSHFPTYLERYLWRFSGLCVACGVPTLLFLFVLTQSTWDTYNIFKIPFRAFKWVMSFRPKDGSFCEVLFFYPLLALIGLVVWVVVAAFGITLCVMVLLYPVTRLYILVEAFASLRSLPVGAYETVIWAEMWPHFWIVSIGRV